MHVRFTPESGHAQRHHQRLLSAISGHRAVTSATARASRLAGARPCLAASLVLGLRQGGNSRCAKMQSTAADRLSRVTGGGVRALSRFGRWLTD